MYFVDVFSTSIHVQTIITRHIFKDKKYYLLLFYEKICEHHRLIEKEKIRRLRFY